MNEQSDDTPISDALWDEIEAALRSPAAGAPVHILFAYDGSGPAEAAIHFLRLLPIPAGSTIDVLTVMDIPSVRLPLELLQAEDEWAAGVGESARRALERPGLRIRTTCRRGSAANEIIKAAAEEDADLVRRPGSAARQDQGEPGHVTTSLPGPFPGRGCANGGPGEAGTIGEAPPGKFRPSQELRGTRTSSALGAPLADLTS